MPNHRKILPHLDLAERAKFYGVCPRTVRRWHNAGADLADACSVATHLGSQKTPAPAAVAAVKTILQNELESLTS
jgi:hypothetical protein